MKRIFNTQTIAFAILSLVFTISCTSDDTSEPTPSAAIKIEEAKLEDFPLLETAYSNIEVIAPEIVDNKETKNGEISITVPATTNLSRLSLKSVGFDQSKFSISPDVNEEQDYTDGSTNTYTISTIAPEAAVLHYTITVVKEVELPVETLKITGFKFEKSKNPSLPNDIEITKTIEDVGMNKIYLFVPVGTDFTKLTPTITYDGTKLLYTTQSTTNEYPEAGISVDFKYPNSFILEVKDRNDSEFKRTNVIVDVINPIKLETETVITPDASKADSASTLTVVTKWINQGNHVLLYRKANTQENQVPTTPTKVITASRTLPGGGLYPGDSANVSTIVNKRDYPVGTYKTTVVIYPRIQYHNEIDELLEPVKLNVTATIID